MIQCGLFFIVNMHSNRSKGYILSILATIFFCHIYIFSKKAMELSSIPQFCFYWFGISFIINSTLLFATKKVKEITTTIKHHYKTLLLLGFLEIIITVSFFSAIHFIPNTAVTGMLGNLFPIFTTILGITVLKEQIHPLEYIGLTAAFIGIIITSFPEEASWVDFMNGGTILIIINCLTAAIATIIIKHKIQKIPPFLLNTNRAIALFIYAISALIVTDATLEVPQAAMTNIVIGAIIGPVIAINLVYYSLKYIEASRATVVQSSKGLVLILCTYLYWGELPKLYQVIGGVVTLLGLLHMSYIENREHKRRKQQKVQKA